MPPVAPPDPGPPESTILRSNAGMIRDAYVEYKDGVNILVIRQIKFDANGSNPETKVIRLTPSEADDVCRLWHESQSTKK